MLTGKQTYYLYCDNINITKKEIEEEFCNYISSALMDGRRYWFKSGELLFDNGSFLAFVDYELYLLFHKECNLNEYLFPNYFENLFFDMDKEYSQDETQFIDKMLFQKTEMGWLRIE